jgi:methyl-accepting chemotaxis protein
MKWFNKINSVLHELRSHFLPLVFYLIFNLIIMVFADPLKERIQIETVWRFLNLGFMLIAGWLTVRVYRKSIRPNEEIIKIGHLLNTEDYPNLTRALIDLGQGDLSEQLTVHAKPLESGYKSEPLNLMVNNLIQNLHKSVREFNAVTGIPCWRLCFVGADSFLEGNRCAEVMVEQLQGKGEAGIVLGSLSHIGQDLRRKGFEAFIHDHAPDIRIVDVTESRRDRNRMVNYMPELLKQHPKLSGMYFTDTGSCYGVVDYLIEHNLKSIKIICHDLAETTVQFMEQGWITAALSQDPIAQGYNPVIYLYNHICCGWIPQTPRQLTHLDVVDQQNLKNFWKSGEGCLQTQEITARLAKPMKRLNDKFLRIGVLGRTETAFWQETQKGVLSAAEHLKPLDVRVEWIVPEENKDKGDTSAGVYGPWIDRLVNEGWDGLAVVASDANLIPAINRAIKSGIPVVTWNTEPANLGNLIHTVKDQANKLKDLSEKLAVSTEQTMQATGRVKYAISDVAQGAVFQDEEISTTMKTLESLLFNINLVNQKAEESTKASEGTVRSVTNGSKAMVASLDRMKSVEAAVSHTGEIVNELEQHSAKIDKIVEMISDIASRVNVLSLNASIEATKAGEYGKGFSVVAEEVRHLAKNTRDATKNAVQLVLTVQGGIEKVQKMMSKSLHQLHETTESTANTKQAIENITRLVEIDRDRMKKIAEMVVQMQSFSNRVGEAMDKVARVSEKNVRTVEDINESTKAMSQELDEVAELAQALGNMAIGEQLLLAKFRLNINHS